MSNRNSLKPSVHVVLTLMEELMFHSKKLLFLCSNPIKSASR